jgi:phytoene dehydrogenase-like protein
MEVSRSIDHLESAFEDAATGRFSEDPFMEVFVQSANDPSLVDGDGDVLSAFTQWAPAGSEGLGAKPSIMRALETHLPGISEVVVGEQFLGPAELRDVFRLPNGDIFHGAMLPEQSFGSRFGYRTSVRGLYLCGSGAWPGGGVMGAPGRNCASVIISEQTS